MYTIKIKAFAESFECVFLPFYSWAYEAFPSTAKKPSRGPGNWGENFSMIILTGNWLIRTALFLGALS